MLSRGSRAGSGIGGGNGNTHTGSSGCRTERVIGGVVFCVVLGVVLLGSALYFPALRSRTAAGQLLAKPGSTQPSIAAPAPAPASADANLIKPQSVSAASLMLAHAPFLAHQPASAPRLMVELSSNTHAAAATPKSQRAHSPSLKERLSSLLPGHAIAVAKAPARVQPAAVAAAVAAASTLPPAAPLISQPPLPSVTNNDDDAAVLPQPWPTPSVLSFPLSMEEAAITISPVTEKLGEFNTETIHALPPHPIAVRGWLLLFHGCSHGGMDWFTLPEERLIVKASLAAGLGVVAFTSKDRFSGCWDNKWVLEGSNIDLKRVRSALTAFAAARGGLGAAPRYALGGSSGGTFVSLLSRVIPLGALIVQISPGYRKAWESPPNGNELLPVPERVGFVFMPRDWQFGSEANVAASVALIRASGDASGTAGRRRVRQWPIYPHALSAHTLHERMPDSITEAMSIRLYSVALEKGHLIDAATLTVPLAAAKSNSNTAPTASTASTARGANALPLAAVLAYDPRDQELISDWAMTIRSEYSSLARQEYLFDAVMAGIGEILNVCWGEHELTSEHFARQILPFILSANPVA